jgi:hypothetical protein
MLNDGGQQIMSGPREKTRGHLALLRILLYSGFFLRNSSHIMFHLEGMRKGGRHLKNLTTH